MSSTALAVDPRAASATTRRASPERWRVSHCGDERTTCRIVIVSRRSTAIVRVGLGCGRWKTRRSPNNRTPTREPCRSLTSAPNSMNSAWTSLHGMLAAPPAGAARRRPCRQQAAASAGRTPRPPPCTAVAAHGVRPGARRGRSSAEPGRSPRRTARPCPPARTSTSRCPCPRSQGTGRSRRTIVVGTTASWWTASCCSRGSSSWIGCGTGSWPAPCSRGGRMGRSQSAGARFAHSVSRSSSPNSAYAGRRPAWASPSWRIFRTPSPRDSRNTCPVRLLRIRDRKLTRS